MTLEIEKFIKIKRLGNSIFVKLDIKLFVKFTDDNLSQKFVVHVTIFF